MTFSSAAFPQSHARADFLPQEQVAWAAQAQVEEPFLPQQVEGIVDILSLVVWLDESGCDGLMIRRIRLV